jgi:hypothetical protein
MAENAAAPASWRRKVDTRSRANVGIFMIFLQNILGCPVPNYNSSFVLTPAEEYPAGTLPAGVKAFEEFASGLK